MRETWRHGRHARAKKLESRTAYHPSRGRWALRRGERPRSEQRMRSRPTQSSAVTRPFAAGQGSATGAGCVSGSALRSEEHTSELQSRLHLVCRLLLEKKKKKRNVE